MPVLVVDEHSSDRTRAIAAEHRATVIERDWAGFVEARVFAMRQVRTEWMLALDADEALDATLRASILAAPAIGNGYAVRRDTYIGACSLRMWRGERLLRLVRVASARVEAHPVAGGNAQLHETYVCDAPIGQCAGRILHYSYADLASYRAKYAQYTDIEAAGAGTGGASVLRAALRFGRSMMMRGALLDGPTGWYVAWMSAVYPLVVAAKARRR